MTSQDQERYDNLLFKGVFATDREIANMGRTIGPRAITVIVIAVVTAICIGVFVLV